MATPKICAIDGCGKPAYRHGWCRSHHSRWYRYGDPLSGRAARGELQRYFREVVMAYEGDECLTWPFGRNAKGYGHDTIMGKRVTISRLVCELANGPPPTPKHQAAHSCGKGHLACCAKNHLSWKTPAENQADKVIHGTNECNRGEKNPNSKLAKADILKIRNLRGDKRSQREIGLMFGVSGQSIGLIQRGDRWSWLE